MFHRTTTTRSHETTISISFRRLAFLYFAAGNLSFCPMLLIFIHISYQYTYSLHSLDIFYPFIPTSPSIIQFTTISTQTNCLQCSYGMQFFECNISSFNYTIFMQTTYVWVYTQTHQFRKCVYMLDVKSKNALFVLRKFGHSNSKL